MLVTRYCLLGLAFRCSFCSFYIKSWNPFWQTSIFSSTTTHLWICCMSGTERSNTAILSTILWTSLLRLPTLLYLCKAKAFCSDKTCFRHIMHERWCDIVMSECESVRQAPSTSSLSGESSDWECRCSNAWIGCRRGQKCLIMPFTSARTNFAHPCLCGAVGAPKV